MPLVSQMLLSDLQKCCLAAVIMYWSWKYHRQAAQLQETVKTENDLSIENKKTNWSCLQKVSRLVLGKPGDNWENSEQDFTLLTLVNTR